MTMTTNQEEDTDTTPKTTTSSSWGTWEDLLLACAVKRHGFKNWDSVAIELQTKTSLPHLLTTAQFCKQKYTDLKRRFKDNHHHTDSNNNNNIPWLEHLRKVRVDELKQDLQRYDLSIHCLQLKVKRLEEERERERCLDNNNTTTDPEPDLSQPNISQPVKSDEQHKASPRGDESDRDNRSVNESNSTGLSEKVVGGEGGGGELVKSEAERSRSGLDGEGAGQGGTRRKAEESEELGDSVTQLSSDVQSSASYGRRKRKMSSGGDTKSEPLIGLLDVIRSHKHASLFERWHKLQESSKYKEIVRQHVDLETIVKRVEQGTYSPCHLSLYRDLLLLFNNAIVFFPMSSPESSTAHELRRLVSIEINKETLAHKPDSSQQPVSLPPQPQPKPHLERSDSLLDKQKSSAPIIVCRKRSSVSAKPSSTFSQKPDQQQQQQSSDDKKPAPTVERSSSSLLKLKTQEKAIITGTRSSRRNSNPTNNTSAATTRTSSTPPLSSSNKKQSTGTGSGSKAGSASVDKQESWRTDNKKKTEASSSAAASDKKKSVVDFLKRIKKNSPVATVKKNNNNKGVNEEPKRNNNNNNNNNNSNNNNSNGKKDKKGKERQSSGERKQSPPKKNVGRPPKKAAESSPVSGKRAREVVVAKRQSKRPRR